MSTPVAEPTEPGEPERLLPATGEDAVVETGVAAEALAEAEEAVVGGRNGMTVLLTGRHGAGKSALALGVAGPLADAGRDVQILDGEETLRYLSGDVEVGTVERIGYVARTLAQHGVTVLVPITAAYASERAAVRALHVETGVPYLEIHVTGGAGEPYDVPDGPDLVLDGAGGDSPAALVERVLAVDI